MSFEEAREGGEPSSPRRSVGDRLRERLGKNVDPRVSLDGGAKAGTGAGTGAGAPPAGPSAEAEATLAGAPSDREEAVSRGGPSRPGTASREGAAHAPGRTDSARGASRSRYDLLGEVARGGMGRILKVWDRDLRRNLAMKVMRERAGSAESDSIHTSRFLEEAQITGQLDHPGIVPVHELGVDPAGRVFFTMRLVRGRDLRTIFDLARRGEEGWSKTRALGVVLKVCEAMAYAHEKRVIHRDLKPANVMVGRFGETYVMDWGLARVLGEEDRHDVRPRDDPRQDPREGGDPSLSQVQTDRREAAESEAGSGLVTMDGDVIGTPAYMAPEQALGDLAQIGSRTDVYAAGALLYHLIADHPPYCPPGERLAARGVLERVLAGPPRSLTKIAPGASAEILAICEKAMARDPGDRYPGMLAMAEDLRAYLEGRVVRAYETGAAAEFRKWVARNRGTATSLACLIVLLVGSALGFAWQQRSLAARILVESRRAREARDGALANEREARRRSYLANVAAADASLRANDVAEAKRRLEACDPSRRGWEWRHLRLRSDASLSVLEHGIRVGAVAFLADGSRLVTGAADGIVRLWEPSTGRLVQALEGHEDAVAGVSVRPGGRQLASASRDGTVRVWEVDTGDLLRTLHEPEGAVAAVAWDPRRARLAWAAAGGSIRIWDEESDETRLLHQGDGRAIAFGPRGKMLAAGSAGGEVIVLDVATGSETLRLAGHEAEVTAVAMDPEGARIASGSIDNTVRTWSLPSGEPLLVLRRHGDPVTDIAFGPGGTTIVSGSMDKTLRVWDAASGEMLAVLRGHDAAVRAVAFAPGGLRAASVSDDGTARLWDPSAGEAVLVLGGPDDVISSIAMSRDGARLAAAGRWRGSTRVWDAASGARLLDVAGNEEAVGCVAIDPAGMRLVTGSEETAVLRVHDVRTGAPILGPLSGHEASITAVVCTPGGAAIVSSSTDGTVRVWDATTGAPRRVLEGHEGPVTAVAVSPDGRWIASASIDTTIRLWNAASGALLRVLEGHGDEVLAVAFDPSGSRLASGSLDQSVRVWDVESGEVRHVLEGHARAVTAVAFGPRGSRLVSGSLDRTVRVWDADCGELLLVLRGHGRPITAVAFAADDRRVVSASFDNTVRIWETSPATERFLSRRAAALVAERVASLIAATDVVASLREDPSLDARLREEALRIAGERGDDPAALFRASWEIASESGGATEGYLRALRLAEIAVRLAPEVAEHQDALGVARFRLGAYHDALEALERARALHGDRKGGTRLENLGFLTLAHRALGHDGDASAMLERLEREERMERGDGRAAGMLEEVHRLWDAVGHERDTTHP